MKYHTQKFGHIPSIGMYGDCHRTAIACILDMERDDVPNFSDGIGDHEADRMLARVHMWLDGIGVRCANVGFRTESLEEVLEFQKLCATGIYYLLIGAGSVGYAHTCVGFGGKLIWDPSLQNSGLHGPMDDGMFCITYLMQGTSVAPLGKKEDSIFVETKETVDSV